MPLAPRRASWRYDTLDAVNDAWGTAFWSQRYAAWDEISPPRQAPTFINPTQQLDFRRFSSDELLACFDLERAILAELTPDVPVTTNFMGFFKPLDYWTWARHEDVVSHDSYPDPADPAAPMQAALSYDLMRSLGHGRPWVLMEQTPSQVNWRAHNVLKRPGQMRLWSLQAIARGADGVMFFQWRASRAGAETFHGGMVPHTGTQGSRVWDAVVALGGELGRLDPVLGARTPAHVAILFDWESWWALELDAKPSSDVRLMDQVRSYYQPLFTRNILVDFVPPDADLAPYTVALVPNLYLVRDGVAANLERFVAAGGRLVMSFFSGMVDPNDHLFLGGYLGPFRSLLGITVEELDPYVPGQTNQIVTADSRSYACDLWSDVIALEGAEAIATFAHDFYAGRPAITRHQFGQGYAYYLGTRPEPAFMDTLLLDVCGDLQSPESPVAAAPGVEVVLRSTDAESFTFALNHHAHAVELPLATPMTDLLTGQRHASALTLGPYGVAVLRRTLE
jgi:beta-galactosidase